MGTTILENPTELRPARLDRRWDGRRYALLLLGLALCGLTLALLVMRARAGDGPREANDDVRFPLSPPSNTAWTTEPALGGLKFFEPTCVVAAGSGRYFVLERRGTLQLVERREDGSGYRKQLVLDIEARTVRTPMDDDGALGLALHPQFGQADSANRGDLYLFYTSDVEGETYDRLSHFTFDEKSARLDPASERILIDQHDENLWHNGGALAFGDDGYLYVGLGDEGGEADSLRNGQQIGRDLFSGIVRIDVDMRGGAASHPPRRQPADGKTAHYYVPSDNPFVGQGGALEEFWSIGLRNPHRMSFDSATGRLWVADVGQILREEVNIATRGSNHQWSYKEGRLDFPRSYLKGVRPEPYVGVETPPLHDYAHVNGNACVIGGYVYRGSRHPELEGKYIYGDNGSGRIWALEYDGHEKVSNVELLSLPVSSKTGISSFALDEEGELLVVVLGAADVVAGRVERIVRAPEGTVSALPPLLSETGLFADLRTLTPATGVVPYAVNSPLWSDGADKRRWILLPGDGSDPDPRNDRIEFSTEGDWRFPAGTVLVKHFELPLDEAAAEGSQASAVRRLETRVLICDAEGGVYGAAYKWNAEGTDAELLPDGFSEELIVKTADGGERRQTWQYPGRAACMVCHNEKSGFVLGVSTRQLAGNVADPAHGVAAEQLLDWGRREMFVDPPGPETLQSAPRLVAIDDVGASLEHRVRSYLDANCAACHRPGGARANFDARFTTPLDLQQLIGGRVNTHDGVPGALVVRPHDPSGSMLVYRMLHGSKPMPPLGVMRRDVEAIGLLSRWIDGLDVPPDVQLPPRPPTVVHELPPAPNEAL